jgi:predicted alpha/beta superfamily hydrolase
MHDGQNLFDPATSFAGSWRVPEAIDALDLETGRAPVVVGVPNGGARRLWEYSPFRDPRWGGGGAARQLAFLVERVRPLALRSFAVDRRPEAHGLGGASLGALVSLWGLFASGGEFGSVLAMSPTTLLAGEALRDFLLRRAHLPARIYLDCGLEEGRRRNRRKRRPASPTAYVRRVRRLRRALEQLGYRRGDELEYLEEPDGIHHESAWARRLPGALRWLYRDGD